MRARMVIVAGLCLALAACWTGATFSAFSQTATSAGNTFATAATFGGCPGTYTPNWLTGMEHGDVGNEVFFGGIGSATADTTVVRTGLRSLRMAKSGSISYKTRTAGGSTHVLHFALRLDALPTGTAILMALDSSVGTDLYLRYNAATQKLALQWGTGTMVDATDTLTTGVWHTIDIKAVANPSPLTANWEIDGAPQATATSAAAATSHNNLNFGSHVSEAPTYVEYFDDIFYSKTAADYPIGDVRVHALRPNANGTHVGATGFRHNDDTAIDATTWSRLDDVTTFGGGTDYVKQVAAGPSDYLEFGVENPAHSCIRGVWAYAALGVLGSSGNTAKASIVDGSTERVIYNATPTCTNCTTAKNALIAPATAPWTQSALEGVVARVGGATAASPTPYWAALMIEYAAE